MNEQELRHIFGIAQETNSDICIELEGTNGFVIILNSNLNIKLKDYINSITEILNAFPIKWLR